MIEITSDEWENGNEDIWVNPDIIIAVQKQPNKEEGCYIHLPKAFNLIGQAGIPQERLDLLISVEEVLERIEETR